MLRYCRGRYPPKLVSRNWGPFLFAGASGVAGAWASLRMVLRSTPSLRAISCCETPRSKSARTACFCCGFKTFTSVPPSPIIGQGAMMSCRDAYAYGCGCVTVTLPMRYCDGIQVGDFQVATAGGVWVAAGAPRPRSTLGGVSARSRRPARLKQDVARPEEENTFAM